LGDFGDEARWDCSVVFWGRFMGQSSQQGLLVLCDSIAMLKCCGFEDKTITAYNLFSSLWHHVSSILHDSIDALFAFGKQ